MPDFSQSDIEAVTGKPFNRRMSTRTEWRFGRQGSLSIDVEGGLFYDHETGQGGAISALLGRTQVYQAPRSRPPVRRKRWSEAAQRLWEGSK